MDDGIKKFYNKKVFIILKSGRQYQGKILNVFSNKILLLDKFKKEVLIDIIEISSMEVEK